MNTRLLVSIDSQTVTLLKNGKVIRSYMCSTSSKGRGSEGGSYKTPVGIHRVFSKHGSEHPFGAIFSERRWTGDVCEDLANGAEDLITSRILRLEGLEPGVNKGDGIDSLERCIYIHGTNQEATIGRPASHGCIRMRNADIIELFELVEVGDEVEIF
ncbi:MAG: L,D-transpeptidase [Planctomycetota bacterium]